MSKAMKIAIVDDEKDMRQSISQWLALSGFDTETYASAEDALKCLSSDYQGIVVSDIKMPGMDGMQFLKKLKGVDSSLPVIMITGHGDVPMAVEAMRKRATTARRLTLDNRALRQELSDGSAIIKKLIGQSPVMERLKEDILDLGQADGHVLIEGETGTGKRGKPGPGKRWSPTRCMRWAHVRRRRSTWSHVLRSMRTVWVAVCSVRQVKTSLFPRLRPPVVVHWCWKMWRRCQTSCKPSF